MPVSEYIDELLYLYSRLGLTVLNARMPFQVIWCSGVAVCAFYRQYTVAIVVQRCIFFDRIQGFSSNTEWSYEAVLPLFCTLPPVEAPSCGSGFY